MRSVMHYDQYTLLAKLPRRDTKSLDPENFNLLHATMGLVGEAGEVSEIIKKHTFYGKELDAQHLKEELGDVLFYLVWVLDEAGLTLEEVAASNIEKLSKRYPNEFGVKS